MPSDREPGFTHAEDIVDALRLKTGDGGGADHAAIGNDAGPGDTEPRAQTLDDRQQRSDIGGIAGPEERGDRTIVSVEHDAQHNLMQLWPEVLGEATLAQRGAAMTLEIQGRGVEERHRQFAEQRLAVAIERLL